MVLLQQSLDGWDDTAQKLRVCDTHSTMQAS
jgi:hypothetical protein